MANVLSDCDKSGLSLTNKPNFLERWKQTHTHNTGETGSIRKKEKPTKSSRNDQLFDNEYHTLHWVSHVAVKICCRGIFCLVYPRQKDANRNLQPTIYVTISVYEQD